MDTLDIAGAATRLGISPDAVRKRIRRGQLQATKAPDGQWRVDVRSLDTLHDQSRDARQDKTGPVPPTPADQAPLVLALQAEVSYLRDELRQAHQRHADERRRADEALAEERRIVAALLSRLPALASPHSPNDTGAAEPEHPPPMAPSVVQAAVGEAGERPTRRPWWRIW